jgi:hypothetical protein
MTMKKVKPITERVAPSPTPIPNDVTRKAVAQARGRKKLKSFKSAEELIRSTQI